MINHKTSSQWAQESLSCFLRGKTFGVNKTKSAACLNESFPPALYQKQKWIKLVEGTYRYVCIIIIKLVWAVFFLIHKTNTLLFKLTSYVIHSDYVSGLQLAQLPALRCSAGCVHFAFYDFWGFFCCWEQLSAASGNKPDSSSKSERNLYNKTKIWKTVKKLKKQKVSLRDVCVIILFGTLHVHICSIVNIQTVIIVA